MEEMGTGVDAREEVCREDSKGLLGHRGFVCISRGLVVFWEGYEAASDSIHCIGCDLEVRVVFPQIAFIHGY